MGERKVIYGGPFVCDDGSVTRPSCCGQPMTDDGDCGHGCCDDYRCDVCGKSIRVEWPD